MATSRIQVTEGSGKSVATHSFTEDAVTKEAQRIAQFAGTTSTLSNVAGSASSVTLKAANTGRIRLTIYNDSTSALYIKEGATASTSSFTWKLAPCDTLIIDDYSGVVDGIWDSATGNARVTEVTV